MKYKTCNKCNTKLPCSEFPIKRSTVDGLYGFCKPCKRLSDKESRNKRALSKPPTDKKCTCCGEFKSQHEYGKNKSKADGLHDSCKSCKNNMARDLYKREKPKILSSNKAWRDSNKDKVIKRSRRYYKDNKQDFIARAATRRATKLTATIPLSQEDKDKIKEFYWLAKDLRAVSGEEYHVDHIVPLQGKNICGLHVPWNLQILPADINLSKGNRYANDA